MIKRNGLYGVQQYKRGEWVSTTIGGYETLEEATESIDSPEFRVINRASQEIVWTFKENT